ncbi:MAG TPA: hypothetical protein VF078_10525 [Nitrospira sp.]
MRSVKILLIAIPCLLLTINANAQINKAPKVEPLPRDLEIQLALSALPPHLRDNATVYGSNLVKGFEVARKGTKGSAPLWREPGTIHSEARGLAFFSVSRRHSVSAFDEAGAKANMRVFFDAAEAQAKGTRPEELKKIIQERYKTHYYKYKAPERAGSSYTLCPVLRTYDDPDNDDKVQTTNNPHVMHFAPNISNEDVGGSTPGINHYPFVILHGPHGYTVQHFGQAERAALTNEYREMLARLCRIKDLWCLPKQ